MTSIRTTIQNRRIEIPAPDEFPDGTEVVVQLQPVGDQTGMKESDWEESPEAITDWLAWLDSLEPLVFSDQELAELEADRLARKQWEKSQFAAHADELAKEWE